VSPTSQQAIQSTKYNRRLIANSISSASFPLYFFSFNRRQSVSLRVPLAAVLVAAFVFKLYQHESSRQVSIQRGVSGYQQSASFKEHNLIKESLFQLKKWI